MTFDELLAAMTPELHQTVKTAVEIGKWPDGRKLSDDERELCLQVIIAYDSKHLSAEERVGFIDTQGKHEKTAEAAKPSNDAQSERPITIKNSLH